MTLKFIKLITLGVLLSACNKNLPTTDTSPRTPEREEITTAGILRTAKLEISYGRLLASPKEFDQKRVLVVAYLGIDKRRLALFQNRESYLMADRMGSIELPGRLETLTATADRYAFKYVVISGVFEFTNGSDEWPERLGILHDYEVLLERMPQSEVKDNNGIVVRVEELD